MNPCPIESDLLVAYQTYFTHSRGEAGDRRSFRDLLYSVYLAVNYPIWTITGVAREKARRKQMFLDRVEPGSLVDFGCGDGEFLGFMKEKGWDVVGIDFDPKAIMAAKTKHGLTLQCGNFKAANLPPNRFDAVTMSNVVEHLPDPVGTLVEIRRILKTGGRLVMTTGNTVGLGHQKFRHNWFGVDPPRHLNLFCKQSLSEVVRRAGLKVVWAGSSSANADIFIGASYTMVENNEHRMGHQPTPSILRTLKAAWWQLREHFALKVNPDCGEELVLICTKSSP